MTEKKEYQPVYCDYTPLVQCPVCFSVIRAANKSDHDKWHRDVSMATLGFGRI